MNMTAIGCTALIGASLLGCIHPNPLLTAPKEKVLKFLEAANDYATEKTHVYHSFGTVYYMCQYNPAGLEDPFSKTPDPCPRFLKAMAQYAKESTIISGVTVDDLNDPEVLKKWGDDISGDN